MSSGPPSPWIWFGNAAKLLPTGGIVDANGNTLGPGTAVNVQTGTSYTLQLSDNGAVVTCNNASAITVTVPASLGVGFQCIIVQLGAGQVTISGSGATIHNRQSQTKTAGQYGFASLVAYAANIFVSGGDMA